MASREAVIDEARRWSGTPFAHQQYTRGLGCDCIGLIGGVALALELPGAREWRDTPAFHNYARQPDPSLLLAGCDAFMNRIGTDEARSADVLIFRFVRDPQHFALITSTDPLYVMHSYSRAGKVTANRVDAKWWRRVVRAYRLRGVD